MYRSLRIYKFSRDLRGKSKNTSPKNTFWNLEQKN